jgi:hypothetical protein
MALKNNNILLKKEKKNTGIGVVIYMLFLNTQVRLLSTTIGIDKNSIFIIISLIRRKERYEKK